MIPLLAFVAVSTLATPTPPPPPPPITSPAPQATPTLPPGVVPMAAPTPAPPSTKPTPAPPSDAQTPDPNRIGLSGVWEVQIQRDSGTTYTHFKIAQKGTVLTGQYLDTNNKRYPVEGSVDGKVVRLVVSLPNGQSITFSGTQDSGTDMLGMVQLASDTVGFTATYRPKYKWIDNLNPNPGLGNEQSGAP